MFNLSRIAFFAVKGAPMLKSPSANSRLRRNSAMDALAESFAVDPASVVFFVEGVGREIGAWLFAVELIVHPVEGKRFDGGAGRDVEIGVFIPAIHVEEKLTDGAGSFLRKGRRREFEGEFVAGVDEGEGFVAMCDEFGNVAVTGAPAAGDEGPWRIRGDAIVVGSERPIGWEILNGAEAAEMEVGYGGHEAVNFGIGIVFLFEERDSVPMKFEGLGEAEAFGAGGQLAFEIDDDGFGFSGGGANGDFDLRPSVGCGFDFERWKWKWK